MKTLFIVISILGLIYILLAKRKFDFFSLAYISAVVYFLPGYFGYAFKPGFIKSNLIIETYMVMNFVLIAIIIGAVIYDFFNKNSVTQKKYSVVGSKNTIYITLSITLVSFILMLATTGSALFSPSKNEMADAMNRWGIVWIESSLLGFVLSTMLKKKGLVLFFLTMLAFNIYIGHRSTAAIAILAVFTYYLFSQGKQRVLIRNFKLSIFAGLLALFFFTYKHIYIAVKLNNWVLVKERIMNPSFYLETIIYSEPFTTQVILNEVLKSNFTVDISHLNTVFHQFVLFSPLFGAESTSFNSLFQPILFNEADFGMASNIWAQMWSSGGWSLLFIFLLVFIGVTYISNILINHTDPVLSSVFIVMTTYWAFYIHRNDLMYQINLEKRVFLIYLLCIIISILISKIRKSNNLMS